MFDVAGLKRIVSAHGGCIAWMMQPPWPAVFSKLPVVQGKRDLLAHPARFQPSRHLLGERAENPAILAYDLLGHFHIRREVRIVGGQAHAVGRLGQVQHVPRQPGEHVLG